MGRPVDGAALKVAAETRIQDLRRDGWDWLIKAFDAEEGPCPDRMKDRIRATDLEQLILWQRAHLDWKVSPWDLVVNPKPPSLLLVGDLEDEGHLITEAAALMKDATEVRFEGLGHINAFLASDRVRTWKPSLPSTPLSGIHNAAMPLTVGAFEGCVS